MTTNGTDTAFLQTLKQFRLEIRFTCRVVQLGYLRCSTQPDNARSSWKLALCWSALFIFYFPPTAFGPFLVDKWRKIRCISKALMLAWGLLPSFMTPFSRLDNSQCCLPNHTAIVIFIKTDFTGFELVFPMEWSPVDLLRWPQLNWAPYRALLRTQETASHLSLPDAYGNSEWQAPMKVTKTKP